MTKEDELRRVHDAIQAILPKDAQFVCVWQTQEPGNGRIVGNAPPLLCRHFGEVLGMTPDGHNDELVEIDVRAGNC